VYVYAEKPYIVSVVHKYRQANEHTVAVGESEYIVNIDYRLPYTVVSDPVHLYSAAAVVVV